VAHWPWNLLLKILKKSPYCGTALGASETHPYLWSGLILCSTTSDHSGLDHEYSFVTFLAGVALVASAGMAVDAPARAADEESLVIVAQIQIQRTTIVRVPPAPTAIVSLTPTRWKEKHAPNCVKWSTMAAAMISGPTTIDLIVKGGTRYRVKLEKSCSSIDFYSGFYVKATADGEVCKDRDSIHSRSGGECVIDTFKTLVPAK
jgi:hypothetical protein